MSTEHDADNDDTIKVGKYVIIQRQEYTKLHKFGNITSTASLGRDLIELENINSCKYFTTFKMVSRQKGKQRVCSLQVADVKTLNLKEDLSINTSGTDNRNIRDDGQSQQLSTEQIQQLKDQALSSTDIVGTLIYNSNTFHSKTEYSQEKYLKKKQKKYFEYLQILKPSIRLICDIMYRQDAAKVLGIRCDTLSQIIGYSNVSSMGNHMLYDSGSNGLVASALLHSMGAKTDAMLVHMHPGNTAQKQALLAMNYPTEQLERCLHVNLYSVLRHYYQADKVTNLMNYDEDGDKQPLAEGAGNKRKNEDDDGGENPSKVLKTEDCAVNSAQVIPNEGEDDTKLCMRYESSVNTDTEIINTDRDIGRNGEEHDLEKGVRRPRWELENARACLLLRERMDSLVIACKEHPLPVFRALVGLMSPGRPFVIYHAHQEVLTDTYIQLRKMPNVVALKLTHSWMRGYQVLPERTHPDVLMQANSGFLLSGWIVAS